MKKIAVLLCTIILGTSTAFGGDSCFLVKEKGVVIKSTGDCSKRYAPRSTFKIALALMGYDAGILKDETHPAWSFKEGYAAFFAS